MANTRKQLGQATGKPTKQPNAAPETEQELPPPPATPTMTAPASQAEVTTVSSQDTLASDVPSDILSLIGNELTHISEEGKVIIRTIVKATQLMINHKDKKITALQNDITKLENRVVQLENQIDEVNQYERRDTLIISGPVLPPENSNENSAEVIIRVIKDNLHLNVTPSDINVAHRLGAKRAQNITRPIIVKLHSRQKKAEIMNACITVRPKLYINESLTAKRRSLFKIIWEIRKQHRDMFQQCYTQEGKICVKLKISTQKHIITTDETLNEFLDKYPILKQPTT